MNRIIITGILSVLIMTVNESCNNEDYLDEIYIDEKEAYRYLQTFEQGMVWDEVTYLTSDPSQYTLNHYEVIADTLSDGTVRNNLFKDSQVIGTVTKDDSGKLYFTKAGTTIPILLYDFTLIDPRRGGVGSCKYNTGFIPYKDLYNRSEWLIICDIRNKWTWMYDKFGGITINGLGSTAGILSPIDPVKRGYTREVLQAYHTYRDPSYTSERRKSGWSKFEYNGMNYNIILRPHIYNNFKSELLPYIPFNFWTSYGIFSELLEHKLITEEEYKALLKLYEDNGYSWD